MVDTDATPTVESIASDFATFGAVHLDVSDGERSLGFWRDLIGLELLGRDDEGMRLGVDGRELVVLHPGERRPVIREASGLYHMSFHLPSLAEYARVFARIEAAGYFQFPTDHPTHLGNYVDDPDGIGLELAFETPAALRAQWIGEPGFEEVEGRGHRWTGREPRHLAWLAAQVPDGDTGPGLSSGTVVGHMHLRVADVAASRSFYIDAIGFTGNAFSPDRKMYDLSAGGSFSHRLAGNIWESAGRPQRPADASGMRHFTLDLRTADDLAATIARVEVAGRPVERHDGAALVVDPSGTSLLLTATTAR